MNFFESVFSFVFGDGDPNERIEDRRWKVIEDSIGSKGGVVTAEELAPFLDVPHVAHVNNNDESFVLPVLLRFDGYPEVDKLGNILYRFPSLQRKKTDCFEPTKQVTEELIYLEENRWNFSKTSALEQAFVVGLGGINFLGVIILSTMLRDVNVVGQPRGTVLVPLAFRLMPWLQAYTASFFAIPAFRWLLLQWKNSGIDERNRARLGWAVALQQGGTALREKLNSARAMAQHTFLGCKRDMSCTAEVFPDRSLEATDWEKTVEGCESKR